jgi:hypothetical protein
VKKKDRFRQTPVPDATMLMLVAHVAGDEFTVVDGELHLTIKSEGRTMIAPPGSLDDLESRRWVRTDGEGTRITFKGRRAVEQWLSARLGPGRIVERLRVTCGTNRETA